MPQATIEPTTITDSDGAIVGWEGLLVPYGMATNDAQRRVIRPPADGIKMRMLPMFIGYQERTAPAHDNAVTGLASITKVWSTPEGVWGSGPFDLDDPEARELARKVSLGFAGWISVDIEPLAITPERGRDGQGTNVFTDWRIAGATLVANAAYNEARIFAITDSSRITPPKAAVDAQRRQYGIDQFANLDFRDDSRVMVTFSGRIPEPETVNMHVQTHAQFAVSGDTDLPWAPREHEWDGPAAARRVQEWADGDGDQMARAFLWRDPDGDPTTQAAYKLGFADIIDGQLTAVYRGLSAANGRLNQTDIPTDDRGDVAARIETLYRSAAEAFDDPSILETINDEGDEAMATPDTETFQNGDGDAPAMDDTTPTDSGSELSTAQLDQVTEYLRPIVADMIDAALSERDAEDVSAADLQQEMQAQMARLGA